MSEPGGQAEIIQLYDEASSELHRVLYRKLGNHHEADEVAHDAFAKLCSVTGRDGIEDLRRYFFTMANRMALNILRRRAVENAYLNSEEAYVRSELESPIMVLDPERIASSDEKLDRVRQAITTLPLKTRHVFLLQRFQDFTYAEISDQLGLSVKAVEYHMHRALRAIMESADGV